MKTTSVTKLLCVSGATALMAALSLSACKRGTVSGEPGSKNIVEIRTKGSDTMIQLATAWAEAYRKKNPAVMVNANGAGPGRALPRSKTTRRTYATPREKSKRRRRRKRNR